MDDREGSCRKEAGLGYSTGTVARGTGEAACQWNSRPRCLLTTHELLNQVLGHLQGVCREGFMWWAVWMARGGRCVWVLRLGTGNVKEGTCHDAHTCGDLVKHGIFICNVQSTHRVARCIL